MSTPSPKTPTANFPSPFPLFFLSLRAYLTAKGHASIHLSFPPPELCIDNAAMIAWAGIEMYEAGWESCILGGGTGVREGRVRALKKWSVDPSASDGGILGVEGWMRSNGKGEEV